VGEVRVHDELAVAPVEHEPVRAPVVAGCRLCCGLWTVAWRDSDSLSMYVEAGCDIWRRTVDNCQVVGPIASALKLAAVARFVPFFF
jgi:hypothetical protein